MQGRKQKFLGVAEPEGQEVLRPLHLEGAGRTLERLREWGSGATTYKPLGPAALSVRTKHPPHSRHHPPVPSGP